MAGTSYVVTADVLYTMGKNDQRVPHLRGESVTGLSPEDVERFKACGAIASPTNPDAKAAKAHPAEADFAATSAGPATQPVRHEDPPASEIVAAKNSGGAQPVPPPKTATKEAWAAYAVDSGQLTADEAKGKSRDELRDELT
jgi:hypothetical protein